MFRIWFNLVILAAMLMFQYHFFPLRANSDTQTCVSDDTEYRSNTSA